MTKEEYINSHYDQYLQYWANVALRFGPFIVLSLIPLDYFVSPENFTAFLAYRFCTAAFLFLLSLFNKKTTSRKRINSSFLLAAAAVSAMIALMIAKFGGHQSPYAPGFILIGIFVSGMVPLQFGVCLIASLIVYSLFFIPILLYDTITNMPLFASESILIFACIATMLILRYFANKRLFHEFGLQFEIDQHKTDLENQVSERTRQLSLTIMHLEQEVHSREKAEKELTEQQGFVSNLIENSSVPTFVLDIHHRVMLWNRACEELTGFRADEMIGTNNQWKPFYPAERPTLADLIVDNRTGELSELYQHFSHSALNPLSIKAEGWYKNLGGKDRYIAFEASPLYNSSQSLIAAIETLHDLTQSKRLEEQLLQSQKIEAIGQLAGGVAHDFNNILTAIVGYAHMTLMKMAKDDPLKLNVEQILQASDRAAALTQSLLAFSRKQIMNPKPVNLNAIVKRLEKLLLRLIREDIHISTLCASEDLTVFADAGQIEQVLMNLVTNARDAMPEGGKIIIKTEAMLMDNTFIDSHGYGRTGSYGLLSVSDSGEGMDARTREKIFEPFFTTKEQGKGTGLGLAMVYGLVKQHDGFIDVQSEPGKGTTFKIYLPLSAGREEIKEVREEAVAVRGGAETVLLAEDDSVLRKLFSTILRNQGYSVIEAADGDEAIQLFVKHRDRIQLLILDGIMPKRNGKQALDEIRLINPNVKALFVSGYPEDIISKQGLIEPGINFLPKPLSPSVLLKKLREALDTTD